MLKELKAKKKFKKRDVRCGAVINKKKTDMHILTHIHTKTLIHIHIHRYIYTHCISSQK